MPSPWPLFDLRLRTSRLVLRSPTDDDLFALLDVARAGVHDPGVMPFAAAWTDLPSPAFERGFLAFFWSCRASWTPERWQLPMAVVLDDRPIGIQELRATDFATLRTVDTGSWLGRAYQGQGIGTEMRAAVLLFAFDHLGATRARSAAYVDNPASLRVSEKLGYRCDGIDVYARRGERTEDVRLLVEPATMCRPGWALEVEGLEACRPTLGLSTG
jgi:RimJ/RimL family protein N-acetyltransferase